MHLLAGAGRHTDSTSQHWVEHLRVPHLSVGTYSLPAGGTDPQQYAQAAKAGRLNEIPSNHSPQFAPVISPTLQVGVEAMLAAAAAWLPPADSSAPTE